jgi:D-galactose 1-dehydrogenase
LNRVRIGLVGVGKIARDQHIPVLEDRLDFQLVATTSRHNHIDGVVNFRDVRDMLARTALDAVAICTPPQHHFDAALASLEAGKHVLLEKPPCRTLAEFDCLAAFAAQEKLTLFQSWHSRFAPAVALATQTLRGHKISSAAVTWKEDVRRWHPGQSWIWEAGGFGIFDPGVNALSILTRILPDEIFVTEARLSVPSNCQAPIAANLALRSVSGIAVTAALDFRQTGDQIWEIRFETDMGEVLLSEGGGRLFVDGREMKHNNAPHAHAEYAPLYDHFAELIRTGQSDADSGPFRLVADAFLIGERVAVEEFHE